MLREHYVAQRCPNGQPSLICRNNYVGAFHTYGGCPPDELESRVRPHRRSGQPHVPPPGSLHH